MVSDRNNIFEIILGPFEFADVTSIEPLLGLHCGGTNNYGEKISIERKTGKQSYKGTHLKLPPCHPTATRWSGFHSITSLPTEFRIISHSTLDDIVKALSFSITASIK